MTGGVRFMKYGCSHTGCGFRTYNKQALVLHELSPHAQCEVCGKSVLANRVNQHVFAAHRRRAIGH